MDGMTVDRQRKDVFSNDFYALKQDVKELLMFMKNV